MRHHSSKLDFLKRIFGPHEKSKDGINYAFKCPGCGKTGSAKKKLVIRIDTDIYQCWVCDVKGKNLSFLLRKFKPHAFQEYQDSFSSSRRCYAAESDVSVEDVQVSLPVGFKLIAAFTDAVDPDLTAVRRYAFSRSLGYADLWYFKIGTCLKGRYRRRLIIPSFDKDGNLNYYVARAIDASQNRKYLNPRVPKRDIIFNEINIDWTKELTIVEGPFDLMKCNENATCLLGSSLSEKYLLFKKIAENKTPVLLALDPDAKKKTHNIAMLLSQYGIGVRLVNILGYDDVGSMNKQRFLDLRESAIEWNSTDRLIHMIGSIKSGSII